MILQAGSLLQEGKYRIERVLGQGGFGITYQGIQSGLNRRVAIKEFFMKEYCNRDRATSQVHVATDGSRQLVERCRLKFLKEAQTIAGMEHPYIVKIHDIFEENGTAYYVMEYIGNGSLKDKVEREGALPESLALKYIRQVGEALDYVHAQNIVHLDVKPSNILLRNNDTPVLIDFGISKRYDDTGSQTSSTPVGISKGYAPLEQYQQGGVESFHPATDIYSLGATLFFLLTGAQPPEATVVYNEGLPAFPVSVSPAVADAVGSAMNPKMKERPQRMGEFLRLLEAGGKPSDRRRAADGEETELLSGGSSGTSVYRQKAFVRRACVVVPLAVLAFLFNCMVPSYGELFRETLPYSVLSLVVSLPLVYFLSKGGGKSLAFFLALFCLGTTALSLFRCGTFPYVLYPLALGACWLYVYAVRLGKRAGWTRVARVVFLPLAGVFLLADVWHSYRPILSVTPGEYVDLGLSVKWASHNLGAYSPKDNGKWYDWEKDVVETENVDNLPDEVSGTDYDPAFRNGEGRMPTREELEELASRCKWQWGTYSGCRGFKVTGPNGNSIFMPWDSDSSGVCIYSSGTFGSTHSSVYGLMLFPYSENEVPDFIGAYNTYGERYVRPVKE